MSEMSESKYDLDVYLLWKKAQSNIPDLSIDEVGEFVEDAIREVGPRKNRSPQELGTAIVELLFEKLDQRRRKGMH